MQKSVQLDKLEEGGNIKENKDRDMQLDCKRSDQMRSLLHITR